MSKNDGGPAFPSTDFERQPDPLRSEVFGGMTLRDYFAAKALASLLQVSSAPQPGESAYAGFAELAAADAYYFADAMLAAREK